LTPQGVFRGSQFVPLYDLNWFGLETSDCALHGLWTSRTVPHIFFYRVLNPNSGDTGGLLLDDWQTVHQGKWQLLRRLME